MKIDKLKALINHPNTPVHEREAAQRIFNALLIKQSKFELYEKWESSKVKQYIWKKV